MAIIYYDGIDLCGYYSVVDLDIAQRMEQLEYHAKFYDGGTRTLLDSLIQAIQDPSLQKQLELYCQVIQKHRYQADQTTEETEKTSWEQVAKEMEQNKDAMAVQPIYQLLTIAEKVVDTNGEGLTQEDITWCNTNANLQLTTDTHTGRQAQRIAPSEDLTIRFPNAKNTLVQDALKKSKNTEMSQKDIDKIAKEAVATYKKNRKEYKAQYAREATKTVLDVLFGTYENRNSNQFDRGELILVGDKTINERMRQYYDDLWGGFEVLDKVSDSDTALKAAESTDSLSVPKFDNWYKDNLNELSAKIVSEASAKGEPVAVYVPQSDGTVSMNPIQLRVLGVKPAELSEKQKKAIDDAHSKVRQAILAKEMDTDLPEVEVARKDNTPEPNGNESNGDNNQLQNEAPEKEAASQDNTPDLDDTKNEVNPIQSQGGSVEAGLQNNATTLNKNEIQVEDNQPLEKKQVQDDENQLQQEQNAGTSSEQNGNEDNTPKPNGNESNGDNNQLQNEEPEKEAALKDNTPDLDDTQNEVELTQPQGDSVEAGLQNNATTLNENGIDLDALFGPIEKKDGKSRTIHNLNRGTLIIAGNKTISEWMQCAYKRYEKKSPKKLEGVISSGQTGKLPFAEWYEQKLNQFCIEMIEQAGKKKIPVDIYAPNADGMVPQNPSSTIRVDGKQCAKEAYRHMRIIQTLDEWFGPFERIMGKPRSRNQYNRGTMVLVGDKTISERMQEYYLANNIKKIFKQWYEEKLDEMSVHFIQEAMERGEPIQAYPCDPNGVVSKDLVDSWIPGYVAGETWKEEHAADLQNAYIRLQANRKVMEANRLQPNSAFCTELFLNSYFQHNKDGVKSKAELHAKIGKGSAYRVNRSGMVSAIICMLAADGYDIEKIMDPTQLQDERMAALEKYLEKLKSVTVTDEKTGEVKWLGDAEWLGEQFYKGQKELLRQIDEKMKGKDLSKPEDRDEMFLKIYPAAMAMFDGFQEVDRHAGAIAGYVKAAQQEATDSEDRTKIANDISYRAGNVATLWNNMYDANAFRAMASSPTPLTAGPYEKELCALMVEHDIFSKWQSSELPFSRSCPTESQIRMMNVPIHLSIVSAMTDKTSEVGIFRSVLEGNQKNQEKWTCYVLSGQFEKDVMVKVEYGNVQNPESVWTLDANGNGIRQDRTVSQTLPTDATFVFSGVLGEAIQKRKQPQAKQSAAQPQTTKAKQPTKKPVQKDKGDTSNQLPKSNSSVTPRIKGSPQPPVPRGGGKFGTKL